MRGREGAREMALRMLYHLELTTGDPEVEKESFWRVNPADPSVKNYAVELADLTLQRRDSIDRQLTERSERWSLKRMDALTRLILRIGACEILFRADVPARVAINEAVKLARKYGPDSAALVNAILDRLHREKAPA